jgi:hypothetical protein
MDNQKNIKFIQALRNLKNDVEYIWRGTDINENQFNTNMEWVINTNSDGQAIITTANPHSEITWTKVKEEMDKL